MCPQARGLCTFTVGLRARRTCRPPEPGALLRVPALLGGRGRASGSEGGLRAPAPSGVAAAGSPQGQAAGWSGCRPPQPGVCTVSRSRRRGPWKTPSILVALGHALAGPEATCPSSKAQWGPAGRVWDGGPGLGSAWRTHSGEQRSLCGRRPASRRGEPLLKGGSNPSRRRGQPCHPCTAAHSPSPAPPRTCPAETETSPHTPGPGAPGPPGDQGPTAAQGLTPTRRLPRRCLDRVWRLSVSRRFCTGGCWEPTVHTPRKKGV